MFIPQSKKAKTELPELESASNLPGTSGMKTWTEQMGFPCIIVKSHQEGEDKVLTMSQSKFVGDGKIDDSATGSGSRWYVPISFTSAGKNVMKVMLDRVL